jgi:hypothetical protein
VDVRHQEHDFDGDAFSHATGRFEKRREGKTGQ